MHATGGNTAHPAHYKNCLSPAQRIYARTCVNAGLPGCTGLSSLCAMSGNVAELSSSQDYSYKCTLW